MTQLTPKTMIEILQIEINWCLSHPEVEGNPDQRNGFIHGLKQAQLLIEKFSRPDTDVIISEVRPGSGMYL